MRACVRWMAVVGLGLGLTSCKVAQALARGDTVGALSNSVESLEAAASCDRLKHEPGYAEEYALGGALAVNFVQAGKGLKLKGQDDALHLYVNTVGRNLAAQSPRPTLTWNFGVLNDTEHFNALSAPGGYVFVTTNLLQQVDNESQLAGVLAHEIAHVVLKHAVHQYVTTKVLACKGANALSPELGKPLLDASEGDGSLDLDADSRLLGWLVDRVLDLINSGNSQDQEYEADRLAVELLLSAGYDPAQYSALLGKTGSGGGGFSHHPKARDRQQRIAGLLQQRDTTFAQVDPATLKSPALPAVVVALKAPAGKKPQGVAKETK